MTVDVDIEREHGHLILKVVLRRENCIIDEQFFFFSFEGTNVGRLVIFNLFDFVVD